MKVISHLLTQCWICGTLLFFGKCFDIYHVSISTYKLSTKLSAIPTLHQSCWGHHGSGMLQFMYDTTHVFLCAPHYHAACCVAHSCTVTAPFAHSQSAGAGMHFDWLNFLSVTRSMVLQGHVWNWHIPRLAIFHVRASTADTLVFKWECSTKHAPCETTHPQPGHSPVYSLQCVFKFHALRV